MVTTELAPYAKAGGLGDMVSSLAKALALRGHDVRIVCPLYGCVRKEESWAPHATPLVVHLGQGEEGYCRRWEGALPGSNVRLYFLEHEGYYGRPEIYSGPWGAHSDNGERFTFLSRAALDLCYALDWMPDVVHAHDWPGGLLPVYLNTVEAHKPLGKAASVFTVHNMKHQGYFAPGILKFAGLPDTVFIPEGLECMGMVNFLKGGLYHSTKLTTVSPTYAKEMQTPEFGHGLDPVVRFRAADLVGVLNGIDAEHWGPQVDEYIPAHYNTQDFRGKAVCKKVLQNRLGLVEDPHVMIFAAVARMDSQKGLDLLAEAIPRVMDNMHAQVVVLGMGEQDLEHWFLSLSYQYPGRVGVHIGYDSALAHLVEAGADVFVMPSRFEPCGLNQMYSMRYGTPPIVRATGGLLDTVESYNEEEGHGAGFVFEEPSTDALFYTMGWACATYYDRPKAFRQLQINGMKQDFSWRHSAQHYEDVYRWAIDQRASF